MGMEAEPGGRQHIKRQRIRRICDRREPYERSGSDWAKRRVGTQSRPGLCWRLERRQGRWLRAARLHHRIVKGTPRRKAWLRCPGLWVEPNDRSWTLVS